MNNRERQSLDNYITGRYGEDQFEGVTKACDLCEESEAKYKVSITDMDGCVIDHAAVCADCIMSVCFTPYDPGKARIDTGVVQRLR